MSRRSRKVQRPTVECPKCGHKRFKFQPVCPACEDKVLRDFDTSTKELIK